MAHGDMHAVNTLVTVIGNERIGANCIVNGLAYDKPNKINAKAKVNLFYTSTFEAFSFQC